LTVKSKKLRAAAAGNSKLRREKMKRIGLKIGLLAVLFLMSSIQATATIETIKGTLGCFNGCNKDKVQFVAQSENHSFEVVGQFVDLSTEVQVTGSGVSVSYGTRSGGANSSIIVKINVDDNAAEGERTIKMRYAVETNGPDTFKVRVVAKGAISQIQYSRRLPFQPGGGPARELVAPTGMPLNEKVILIVSGTKLDNIRVLPKTGFQSVRIISAAANEATIEMEFSSAGQTTLSIVDASLATETILTSGITKFTYTGSPTIQFGGNQSSGSTFAGQTPGSRSSGGGGGTFVDAAPRASMLNVFRRQSQNPVFTENGVQYFNAPQNTPGFCNGMSGNQSQIITVPNPVWGVTNVGTENIATAFTVQLKSGNNVLDAQNITSLNTGQTRDFTFQRQNSQVRVFTFANRNGCFISPTADRFFEDQPFTVVVDTNGALPEAAANKANNSRNF
jgi:hypothetical protein